jgi:hypothetical protein
MRYQEFASHAYYRAVGSVSKIVSQQEKAFCVLCFEVSKFVITVQREFCAQFRTAEGYIWYRVAVPSYYPLRSLSSSSVAYVTRHHCGCCLVVDPLGIIIILIIRACQHKCPGMHHSLFLVASSTCVVVMHLFYRIKRFHPWIVGSTLYCWAALAIASNDVLSCALRGSVLVFHTVHDTRARIVSKGKQLRKHEFYCRSKKKIQKKTFYCKWTIRAITDDHFDSSKLHFQ